MQTNALDSRREFSTEILSILLEIALFPLVRFSVSPCRLENVIRVCIHW